MRNDLYDREREKYIREKIRMLRQDFKISLSKKEIAHLCELETEIAVDNFARAILAKKLK